MAKILAVNPSEIPEVIEVGIDTTLIPVHVEIEFHSIDLQLKMEYMLYLYAYDVRGEKDIPVLLNNWDESKISCIPQETEDDILGKVSLPVIARSNIQTIEAELELKLGVLHRNKHYERRHLRIFAELIPAVGVASKWSKAIEAGVAH